MPRPKTPPADRENELYEAWAVTPTPEGERAFLFALREHASRVCWMILRQSSPDLIEEIVFKVFSNLGSFKGESKFSTWVHGVMKNWCYNARRSQRARKEVPLEYAERMTTAPEFEQQVLLEDMLGRTFDVRDRAVVELRTEGLGLQEIGERLGISPKAVQKRLRKIAGRIESARE